jgi:hypothetical protein
MDGRLAYKARYQKSPVLLTISKDTTGTLAFSIKKATP